MRATWLRAIYSTLFYMVIPLVLLRLLWRSQRNPAYAKRWRERFAHIPTIPAGGIWLHAVSLGETIAATPLINKLKTLYPHKPILITTTTPTGSQQVKHAFGEEVYHVYAPYDLPDAVHRFMERTRPALAIMMETELWPNLYAACYQKKIPLLIANARLSQRSTRGYTKIKILTREMFHHTARIAAQSKIDADRFIALGLNPDKLTITGSMKFDLTLPASLFEQASLLRQLWGAHRSVLIAASTHEGEDELILQSFEIIRAAIPDALLVLVPRHPERFSKVTQLCRKQGLNVVLRSEKKPCHANTHVFIGDSMGELCVFYAASDVAFVGGSLTKTGGHNPLEPAACGLPIFMGPHVFNFIEITELLKNANALQVIHSPQELATAVIPLLQNAHQREIIGKKASEVVTNNRGALHRHLELIQQLLTV